MSSDLMNRLNYLRIISQTLVEQDEDYKLSSFYGMIIRQIRLKNQISGSSVMERNFCKKCLCFKNCKQARFKLKKKFFSIKCNNCKYVKSYKISKNF